MTTRLAKSLPWAPLETYLSDHGYPTDTNKGVARLLGVGSSSTVKRWREGTNPIGWTHADRLANHIGAHPAEIWFREWDGAA